MMRRQPSTAAGPAASKTADRWASWGTGGGAFERLPLGGGRQRPFAPAACGDVARDEVTAPQVRQRPMERLAGDAERPGQLADADAGAAGHDVEHPVVHPAEPVLGEHGVGVVDE